MKPIEDRRERALPEEHWAAARAERDTRTGPIRGKMSCATSANRALREMQCQRSVDTVAKTMK